MRPTLLKNSSVVDPIDGIQEKTDVFINSQGVIEGVERNISPPEGSVLIDAENKYIFPGFIDPHTHLREPGEEDKEDLESGARAGLNGGFVVICCMPNTNPPLDSGSLIRFIREKSKRICPIEVIPVGCISKGRKGKELSEIGDMVAQGACAISDDGDWLKDSSLMRRAMEYALSFDIPVISHCEDSELVRGGLVNESAETIKIGLTGRPKEAETIAIFRDISLAKLTKAKLHIAHITTKEGIELLKEGKENGINLTGEVTPHHLTLTESACYEYDTFAKVNPPLRKEEDRVALIEAVKDGVIDFFASDHAPHLLYEKEREFNLAPPGISGLETAFSVYYKVFQENKLPLPLLSRLLSYNPANFLRREKLGRVKNGYWASLTLVDLQKEWICDPKKFHSKGKNTPFKGWTLSGKIEAVFVKGVIYSDESEASCLTSGEEFNASRKTL